MNLDDSSMSVDVALEQTLPPTSAATSSAVVAPSSQQQRRPGMTPPMSPSSSQLWSPSSKSNRSISYSDRFIPSRAVSARLDFSVLDREAATSDATRIASGREV